MTITIDTVKVTMNQTVAVSQKTVVKKTGTITGIVTDKSQLPIDGVAVSTDSGQSAITGTDGVYLLTNVPGGTHTLTFTNSMYQTTKKEGIIFTTGQALTGVDTSLVKLLSSISGTVQDSMERIPVAGISVTTTPGGHSTTTGADGTYTIPNVPQGTYTVTFSHVIFLTKSQNDVVLSDGQYLTGLNMSLVKKSGTITGIVTDKSQLPIAGIAVSTDCGQSAITGTDGVYLLTDVQGGIYKLTFTSSHYQTVQKEGILLAPGQALTGVDTSLVKLLSSISGTITDSANIPIANISVMVDSVHKITTGDDGKFSINNLEAGMYKVSCVSTQFTSVTSDSIKLRAGLDTTGFLFKLVYMKSSIRGVVSDMHGKLLGDIRVSIGVTDITNVATTTSAPDGSYTLPNILPGTYKIQFSGTNYLPVSKDTVSLAVNENKANINAQLKYKYGWISGTVTDSLQIPIDGVTVSVNQIPTATTNPSGKYLIDNKLSAGKYILTFSHQQYALANSDSVTVTSDDTTKNVDARLSILRSSISGIVTDSISGSPISEVKVTIAGIADVTTLSDGSYVIGNTLPGTYTIEFQRIGYISRQLTAISVLPNKHVAGKNITLVPAPVNKLIGGTITGATDSVVFVTSTLSGDNIDNPSQWMDTLDYNTTDKSISGTLKAPGYGNLWKLAIRIFNRSGIMVGYREKTFPRTTTYITLDPINALNAKPIADAGDDTAVSINDTIHLHGRAVDSFSVHGITGDVKSKNNISKWEWSINGGSFIQTSTPDTNITVPNLSNLSYKCVLRVTDSDSNMSYSDTCIVRVHTYAPVVTATSTEAKVSIKDVIHLHAVATDTIGNIVKWEWDVGNTGTFKQISTADTAILAPDSPLGSYMCVVRATDDDSNSVMSSVSINVVLDAPVVSAGKDSSVHMNELIKLTGTASQQFGTISEWAWKIGTTGSWISSTIDSTITFLSSSTPIDSFPCYLRVKDDDENFAYDTVNLTIGMWEYIGPSGFSSAATGTFNLVFNSNIPYLAFKDQGNSKVSVMKFNGIIWEYVGPSAFSSASVGPITLSFDGNTPYVCCTENSIANKASVMKFNGTSWEYVGLPGLSTGSVYTMKVVLNSSIPYIAYFDNFTMEGVVMKYNGVNWVQVGTSFTEDRTYSIELEFDESNVPYVAFDTNSTSVIVKKLTGTNWTKVGSNLGNNIQCFDLKINAGYPYVAYFENGGACKIQSWSGSNWQTVFQPNPTLSSGSAGQIYIGLDGGNSYLSSDFQSSVMGYTPIVMQYTSAKWKQVGLNLKNISVDQFGVDFAVNNGLPYIAIRDAGYSNKLSVLQFK